MVRYIVRIKAYNSTRFEETEAGCGRLTSTLTDEWRTNVASTQDKVLDGHAPREDKRFQLIIRNTFRQG